MPPNSHSGCRRFLSSSVILLLSLIAFWVLPVRMAFATDADDAKEDLLVMTFNIRYGTANDGPDRWENRKDQVCDVIERYHCDVVGLQEALRFQIDAIREALPVYDEIGVGRDDGKTKGEYSNILYRKDRLELIDSGTFWLSDTPEVVGSKSWGNNITRICAWGRFLHKPSGKAFYHFNLHMDHQVPTLAERRGLGGSAHRQSRVPDPVILTGDFNAGESNPAVRYLRLEVPLESGPWGPARATSCFVDTFRVLHPEATEVGTFNGFKGDRSGEKIDYIFVEPGRRVLEAAIFTTTRTAAIHRIIFRRGPALASRRHHLSSRQQDRQQQNDGRSWQRAWKTLDPVNAHRFEPGDVIVFKAGTVYAGPFKPQGSGLPGYPIIVRMEGMMTHRPRIEGRGIQDAILLENSNTGN